MADLKNVVCALGDVHDCGELQPKKRRIQGIETMTVDDDLMSYLSGSTFDDDNDDTILSHLNNDCDDIPSDDGLWQPFQSRGATGSPESVMNCTKPADVLVVHRPPLSTRGNSLSRNAISARENRQKKKMYLANLEQSVKKLSEENASLKSHSRRQMKTIKQLQFENTYLNNVLANQSALSSVLKCVQNAQTGIKLVGRLSITEKSDALMDELAHSTQLVQQAKASSAETMKANTETSESAKQCKHEEFQTSLQAAQREAPFLSSRWNPKAELDYGGENTTDGIFSALYGSGCSTGREVIEVNDNSASAETDSGSDSDDYDLGSFHAEIPSSESDAGICLHVSGQRVSVELCPMCNYRSVQTGSADHSYVKLKKRNK